MLEKLAAWLMPPTSSCWYESIPKLFGFADADHEPLVYYWVSRK